MEFPTVMNWTIPFPILGFLCGIFHFYSNFKRKFCNQTVENQIRRRILRRLIWFCTVCRCPTKRTLGLYRLKLLYNRPMRLEFCVWSEVYLLSYTVGMRAANALTTQWMCRLVWALAGCLSDKYQLHLPIHTCALSVPNVPLGWFHGRVYYMWSGHFLNTVA